MSCQESPDFSPRYVVNGHEFANKEDAENYKNDLINAEYNTMMETFSVSILKETDNGNGTTNTINFTHFSLNDTYSDDAKYYVFNHYSGANILCESKQSILDEISIILEQSMSRLNARYCVYEISDEESNDSK